MSKSDAGDALAAAKEWASCFSVAGVATSDQNARALLSRAAAATDGRYTEVSFARALSMLLIGLDFDRWDERTATEFARRLTAVAEQLEEAAMSADVPDPAIRPVLEARAGALLAKLAKVAGPDAARVLLEGIFGREGKG
ncbi:MAG: hypothetical protein HQL38_08940 [Alphaproteobacteria bacterium]|nr:hypothetical protein [Alphaproteobacteria bacterium]